MVYQNIRQEKTIYAYQNLPRIRARILCLELSL